MTLRVREQRDWNPSVREGEPGARDDNATQQDTIPQSLSKASRTGLRTVTVLPSSKSKVTSQAPSQASHQARTWLGTGPPTTKLRLGAGAPAQVGAPGECK